MKNTGNIDDKSLSVTTDSLVISMLHKSFSKVWHKAIDTVNMIIPSKTVNKDSLVNIFGFFPNSLSITAVIKTNAIYIITIPDTQNMIKSLLTTQSNML